jgi:hypothetical protein
VSDQQRIQRFALENGLQLLQPAFVIHSESLTRGSEPRAALTQARVERTLLSAAPKKMSSRPEPERKRRWSGGTLCPAPGQEKAHMAIAANRERGCRLAHLYGSGRNSGRGCLKVLSRTRLRRRHCHLFPSCRKDSRPRPKPGPLQGWLHRFHL